jgi:prevent-host-death family protein
MQVTLEEASANLEELIRRAVATSSEIVITRDNIAVARLTPVAEQRRAPREPGSAKGLVTVPPDFDETPPDFEEYMQHASWVKNEKGS